MKIAILFILMLVGSLLKSQEIDSILYLPNKTSEVDSIKVKVARYLINSGELQPNDDFLNLYNSRVYTTSLIDNKILEFKKRGLFRIITTTSHSPRFLLMVDEHIKILNYKDLSQTLNEVIEFLKKHNESDKDIADYIQVVLNEYRMDIERIKFKK